MFYEFIRVIAKILSYSLYRFELSGFENIPEEGAFLLCGNHISAFDPIAVAAFSKRPLRFMAKQELFKFPPLAAFLKKLGAFPINRGATDMNAYRETMKLLKNGEGMLIFSQGTRMNDFDNAKSGVAVFALKSGAPIVPVGIIGPFKFRRKIKIRVGTPISMEKYQGEKVKTELVDEVMNTLAERITALLG